jgi:hypothetical protein
MGGQLFHISGELLCPILPWMPTCRQPLSGYKEIYLYHCPHLMSLLYCLCGFRHSAQPSVALGAATAGPLPSSTTPRSSVHGDNYDIETVLESTQKTDDRVHTTIKYRGFWESSLGCLAHGVVVSPYQGWNTRVIKKKDQILGFGSPFVSLRPIFIHGDNYDIETVPWFLWCREVPRDDSFINLDLQA